MKTYNPQPLGYLADVNKLKTLRMPQNTHQKIIFRPKNSSMVIKGHKP